MKKSQIEAKITQLERQRDHMQDEAKLADVQIKALKAELKNAKEE